MLMDVTIQPVMFVLLFAYVFGGSIAVPGIELPRVPAARDHGPDDRVLLVRRRRRAHGRPRQGDRRPDALAADLAVRGAGRAEHLQPDALEHRHRRDGGDRPADRMADPQRCRSTAALAFLLLLLFGFSMIWLGIWVGSTDALGRVRAGLHVHGDVPADVRRQHVRSDPRHAGLAAHDRRVEPGVVAHPGVPQPVGQRPAGARDAAWPLHHPEVSVIAWAVLFTVVFAPMAVRAFRRRARD